jgi:hypothetical protein
MTNSFAKLLSLVLQLLVSEDIPDAKTIKLKRKLFLTFEKCRLAGCAF